MVHWRTPRLVSCISALVLGAVFAGSVLGASAGAAAPSARGVAAAFSGVNGVIAFSVPSRSCPSCSAIATEQPNGARRRVLRRASQFNEQPAFSRDGARIVFAGGYTRPRSNREGVFDIFTMLTDGSRLRHLTHSCAGNRCGAAAPNNAEPAFSPNGREIVFLRTVFPTVHADVFIMRSDGSHVRQLTNAAAAPCPNSAYNDPSISPNGRTIVFAFTGCDASTEIYAMNPDGSNVRQLTHTPGLIANGPGLSEHPDFSPNGRRIVFIRALTDFTLQILSMNVDGSDIKQLTHKPAPGVGDARPAYSPDGRKIAFPGAVMNADGSGLRHMNIIGNPTWQPRPRRR